jgi:hypothetical protein
MSQKYHVPVLAMTVVILIGCDNPNDSSPSDTAVAAARRAQIEKDCGISKEETEAWFATHESGWTEDVEAGLKCIREHP